jgi:hypothetical protein
VPLKKGNSYTIYFSVGSITKTDDAMSLELKTFLLNSYPTFANKEAKYFAREAKSSQNMLIAALL